MKKALLRTLYFVPLIFLSFSIFAQVDDPRARMEAEMAPVRDPATGKIPIERLIQAREEIKKRLSQNAAIGGITWNERGPNNIGGRTRAVVFDPNDATAKKVWAGGVGGGLWYNNDITSAATVWQKVDDFWANLAISSIAFDPANTQNIYVGTGEGWFNGDAQQGAGIWKSSNGGVNWTQLASTASNTDFNLVQKIVVNSTGIVFAATQGGVYKSTDGGTTWTINLKPTTLAGAVAPVNNFAADLEIGTDGVIYASFGRIFNQGSRIFKTADAGGTWTQITSDASQYRTEIALAPSTSGATQVIYAITQSGSYDTAWLRKSVNAGATWTDATPSSSLTGGQAWYDLILAVKPNDPNIVIGGGNVIGRTTNGSTWTTRGYYAEGLHPDHHAIVYRPGFPNEVVNGNDGGVYYSPDYGNASTVTPTFNIRNNGFNVTQYYGAALKNVAGDGYILAGAQDNGTHRINSLLNTVGAGTQVFGGDGMLCFIDQDQPNYQIVSYQNGVYLFYNAATNTTLSLGTTGTEFIGPSDYNSSQNVLYAEKSATSMNRVAGIGGVTSTTTITHTTVGGTSLIRCGLSDNTVYVGGSNGNIIKIVNAGNVGGTQTITTIATGFAGTVSCVEIGATENELLVTRSNYGIKSVYYTTDGGATWTSKDEVGYGLPDIPVRFALFNPLNRKQVLLATELGVFSTSDVTLTNPGWEPTNASLANVSCYMLRYRTSDGTVAVATHGRGVYTTSLSSCSPPTGATAGSNSPVLVGGTINLTSSSTGGTSQVWAGPNSFASTAQNPTIASATSSMAGVYTVIITSSGTCTAMATTNVVVNPVPTVCSPPTGATAGSNSPVLVGGTINLTSSSTGGTSQVWAGPNSFASTAQNPTIASATSGMAGVYTVIITSSGTCTAMATTNVVVNPVPTVCSPPTGATAGSNSPVLVGGTINLTSSSTGGTSQVWAGPNSFASTAQNPTIASATSSMAGVYTVIITSSGTCTAMATTNVVVNPVPTVCSPPTGATAGSNSPVLVGGTINLTSSSTGGTSQVWAGPNSFASTAQNPTIASATSGMAGVYTVIITSSGTCTAMATTNVVVNPVPTVCSPPTGATAGSNSPVLVGGTINLTSSSTGGTSQVWAGPNSFASTAQNPTIASATSGMAGVYTVIITSSGTCTAMATTNVVVNPVPTVCSPPTGATAGSNSPVLVGGTINLTSSSTGGTSQVWAGPNSFASTAQNPTIASATSGMAGVYTVIITSSGTCTAMATTNVIIAIPPTAAVVFVNIANAAAPTQDGNSWATAYGNLQTALSLAPVNSEIWVAQGTYKPTTNPDRTIAFNIPSGAKLFGGFLGTEAAQSQRNFTTNSTILSGEIGSVSTVSDNSYHVVTFLGVNTSTVLDGFTVMAGNANLTAERVRIVPPPPGQPLSINDGGGIGLDNASSPMIVNCKIISNDGISGGGLFATNGSNPTIMNSIFRNNQATFGGAIYHLSSNPVYKNVLMSGNKATGGAMYNNGSNPTLTNATIAGNGGLNGAIFNSSSTPVIKNSILWGNVTPFNDVQSIISYSIVEGGYPGVGNLNLNPQFVNLFPHGLAPTLSGDYTLTNTSPGIDAGDNGTIGLTDKDLIGNLRLFNGGLVDIGAYEFQGSRIGGTVISITSGNWETGTTWDIGRKPLAGDMVIINSNHIVIVNANGVLKNIELKSNAQVLYSTAGVKLQTGF